MPQAADVNFSDLPQTPQIENASKRRRASTVRTNNPSAELSNPKETQPLPAENKRKDKNENRLVRVDLMQIDTERADALL